MKSNRIFVRCSDDEKRAIEQLAKSYNLSTSNYIRKRAFEDKGSFSDDNINIAIKVFMDISLDLSRVCSNLNQIAHSLNKKELVHMRTLKQIINEYYTQNKNLHNELKKFIKELSK